MYVHAERLCGLRGMDDVRCFAHSDRYIWSLMRVVGSESLNVGLISSGRTLPLWSERECDFLKRLPIVCGLCCMFEISSFVSLKRIGSVHLWLMYGNVSDQ